MSKRTWLLVTALGSLCLGLALVAVVALLNLLAPRPEPTPPIPSPVPPTATSLPSQTTAVAPPSGVPAGLSAEVRAQIADIEAQVVLLRGLQPSGPVERTLLSTQDLRQNILDDFLQDYSRQEADSEALLLGLLGLLPPDFDLWGLYADLYTEQLAGYYDPETQAMYVVRGQGFDGPERVTYAHEYVHVLQDQHFDVQGRLGASDEACDQEADRCEALRALLEGDATLLESQWLRTYAGEDDLRELQAFYVNLESPVFLSAPEFVQENLLFPYAYGLEFVRQLYLDGSWPAVDAAYATPPESTEQILHPTRFPEEAPLDLQPPDLLPALGAGWREAGRGVLGEWTTRLILMSQVSQDTAVTAADGWGGDFFVALENPRSGPALVWLTCWDGLRHAEEAFAAFRAFGDARFGDHTATATFAIQWSNATGFASLERQSVQSLWIQAPDEATATALRQAIGFPIRVP